MRISGTDYYFTIIPSWIRVTDWYLSSEEKRFFDMLFQLGENG